jgi:hypothetical protein
MKVRVISALALGTASLIGDYALGSETRYSVLQMNQGVQDEVQVFRYPGLIAKYQLASIELGNADNTEVYGGAMGKFGTTSVGVYVSRNDWLFTDRVEGTAISLFDQAQTAFLTKENNVSYLDEPERPIEALLGFDMGGNVLGVRLAFASMKDNRKSTTAGVETNGKSSAEQVQIGLGFHTDAPGSLDLALTVDPIATQKRSESSAGADSSVSVKGNMGLRLDGRWLASDKGSSPYVAGRISSRSYKVSYSALGQSKSSKFDDQIMAAEGGYAFHSTRNNAKLYTGAVLTKAESKGPTVSGIGAKTQLSFASKEDKAKLDSMFLAGTISAEADVWGSVGAMVGMHYILYGTQTLKDPTGDTEIKIEKTVDETRDSDLWALGIYYKVDTLRLDASYMKDFLYNGPYFISGNATKPMLTRISASYAF